MKTEIFIGTASWQEPDFITHWYPKGLSKTKLLPYYAEHFNFVEVNGSFYGIPQAKTVSTWCTQTPDDFIFTVKLHKLLSRHSTEAKFFRLIFANAPQSPTEKSISLPKWKSWLPNVFLLEYNRSLMKKNLAHCCCNCRLPFGPKRISFPNSKTFLNCLQNFLWPWN